MLTKQSSGLGLLNFQIQISDCIVEFLEALILLGLRMLIFREKLVAAVNCAFYYVFHFS